MPDRAPSATTSRPFGRMLPRMRTRPPGPASQRLARELARYESPGVSTIGTGDLPIVWERARGANVLDADGNVYVDLTAGFGVANLGHAHPRVAAGLEMTDPFGLTSLTSAQAAITLRPDGQVDHAVAVQIAQRGH